MDFISQSFHPNFFVSTPQLPLLLLLLLLFTFLWFHHHRTHQWRRRQRRWLNIQVVVFVYVFAHKLLVTHFNSVGKILEKCTKCNFFWHKFGLPIIIRFRYDCYLPESQHPNCHTQKNHLHECIRNVCDSVRAQESNCVDVKCVWMPNNRALVLVNSVEECVSFIFMFQFSTIFFFYCFDRLRVLCVTFVSLSLLVVC